MPAARTPPVIWVVDDTVVDQALIQSAFDALDEPPTLRSLYSAEEALQCLHDGEVPDLVLLDLHMPGRGGLFFLEQRQQRGLCPVPVVVMSASEDERSVEKCYRFGAATFVDKPVDYDGLKRLAHMLTEYWFTQARLPTPVPPQRVVSAS